MPYSLRCGVGEVSAKAGQVLWLHAGLYAKPVGRAGITVSFLGLDHGDHDEVVPEPDFRA